MAFELPQWDSILTQEKRKKELYKAQKASGTSTQ